MRSAVRIGGNLLALALARRDSARAVSGGVPLLPAGAGPPQPALLLLLHRCQHSTASALPMGTP